MRHSWIRLATSLVVCGAAYSPLQAQKPAVAATIAVLPTALPPVGIAASTDGRFLYVVERAAAALAPDGGCVVPTGLPSTPEQIEVFDTATRARVAVLDGAAAEFPRQTAVDPVRHVAYMAQAASPDVDVIDTATGVRLRTISTGLLTAVGFSSIDPARRRLYVAGTGADEVVNNQVVNQRVRVIDLATEQAVRDIVLANIHGAGVDPATGRLWVLSSGMDATAAPTSHAVVFDPNTLTETARIPVGRCPSGLAFDTARHLAYVTNAADQSISVIDMTKVPTLSGALAAPAGLRAIVSGTSVSATWSSIPGAASYDLEVGSQPGTTNLIVLKTTGLGLTGTLPPGAYYFRVRAKLPGGAASEPSNEVAVTIAAVSGQSSIAAVYSTGMAGPPSLPTRPFGTEVQPRDVDPCGYTVDPTTVMVGAAGSTVTLAVTNTQGTVCEWTAASALDSEFLAVTGGASGIGTGSVTVAVAPSTGVPRIGTVLIDGTRVTVMQCAHAVTPTSASLGSTGGTISFSVTTQGGCDWTAVSDSAFLEFITGSSDTGDGTITLTATPNTGAARTGTVTIAGQTIAVAQSGAAGQCAYVVTPGSATAPANGGALMFTVTTQPACQWTATSQDSFLAITDGTSGTGNATVVATASSNPDVIRTGTLAIAGRTVTITQDAAGLASCALNVSPANASISAGSGSLILTVNRTGGAGCNWTAVSNSSFLTISGAATGVDDAPVVVIVPANTGSVRSGTLTIAGQTVAVTQDGTPSPACTYNVTPGGWNVWHGGDPLTFTVAITNGTNCTWTAVPNAAFLTVAGMPPQTGGAVTVIVAPNTAANAPARSGTLTIAGHVVGVYQDSGCGLDVSPTSETAPIGGGTRIFVVTKTRGTACSWTAESNTGFLTITGGTSGTDSGMVTVSVPPNTGVGRSGTIRIAGRTITITQDQATGCVFDVSPGTIAVPGSGGTRLFAVTAVQGTSCVWTAVSNSAFLTVTDGSSGVGSGTSTVLVAKSDVESRSGTLSIAGQTITVNQSRTCTFDVAPATATVTGSGGSITFTITNVQGTGCTWNVTNSNAFLTIAGSGSGSGSGSVTLTAAANTGPLRSATVTIADRTVTIVQDLAACGLDVSPTTVTVSASGGTSTFTVANTQGTGCSWTSASDSPFLTITSGSAGTGSGSVTVTTSANSGAARNGTVTIAGRTITIAQDGVAGCVFEVSPTLIEVPQDAATRTFTVTNTQGTNCSRSAASNTAFLAVTSGSAGTGSGSVTVAIAAHIGTSQRSGTLTIAGQTVTVKQDPPPATLDCMFGVSPLEASMAASGGTKVFTVTQTQGTNCPWNAIVNSGNDGPFFSVTSGSTGTGSGTVTITVPANTSGAGRFSTLTIAGQRVTVSQTASGTSPPCAYSVTPTLVNNVAFSGGTATFTVTNTQGSNCSWSTVNHSGFMMTITAGASGTGSGSLTVSVLANNGAARYGRLDIAGTIVTVTQAAFPACAYSVTPSTASVAAAGGTATFTVSNTQGSGCNWTASSNAGFLTVTGGSSGTGNGTTSVSVASNSGAARSGTLTIAGQSVTVTQASAPAVSCAFTVTPTSRQVGHDDSNTTFTVVNTQGTGCTWTAVPNVAFMKVASGASGTGNGIVNVYVESNPDRSGSSRSGPVTIAGHMVMVNQAGVPCAYGYPLTAAMPPVGGTTAITVTYVQGANCSWTARSHHSFLTINPTSGTNSGTITLSRTPNTPVAGEGDITFEIWQGSTRVTGNGIKVR